jgi:hypothetical protein
MIQEKLIEDTHTSPEYQDPVLDLLLIRFSTQPFFVSLIGSLILGQKVFETGNIFRNEGRINHTGRGERGS